MNEHRRKIPSLRHYNLKKQIKDLAIFFNWTQLLIDKDRLEQLADELEENEVENEIEISDTTKIN